MKLHHLALAAALVAGAASVHAATFGVAPDATKLAIVEAADGSTSATYNGATVDNLLLISGASASAKTIGAFVISDNCDTSTLSVMWDSATGANYRGYACDLKAGNIIAAGATGSLVVVKRDAGGSAQGVTPIATPAKIAFMNFAGCTAVAGSPVASLNQPTYTCTGTGSYYPDAGTSDVEPAIIAASVNGGSGALTVTGAMTTTAIFQQVIGVAVNTKLYRALQQTQGLDYTSTAKDDPVNRPSLPSDFVASAVANKLTGGTATAESKKGWGLVVSDTVDASVHKKQINICRRANGSGTQAAAYLRFQENPCVGPAALAPVANTTVLSVIGGGTSSNGTAYSSTGLLEGCLGAVEALPDTGFGAAYAIGHIGRDNDPFAGGGDKGYRFVKLDGAQPEAHPDATTGKCDGTRAFAGCDDAQSGRYNYVYESTMQWNSGTPGNAAKLARLTNIATKGFTGTQLQGNPAAVIAGVMALPSSYTGLFGALPATDVGRIFGSRVTRNANSCTPLYVAK
jgi:hypothetical protein